MNLITARMILIVYVIVLVTVSALYVFTATFAATARAPTPGLENAIPVFVDLLKVIVGAVIGAVSTAIGISRRE